MISSEETQDESRSQKQANRNNLNFQRIYGRFSPGGILMIIIGGIALAQVVATLIVYYTGEWSSGLEVLVDATIDVVIIFPMLYYLSFKPLLLQIQHRKQSESILQSRLRLLQFANSHTLDELLQIILDEIEFLTGSTISFFHFLDADQKTLSLQAWSTNTLQNMCKAEGKGNHYAVEQAGVWADAARQRQALIHNEYALLPDRKGMPEGHALIVREMVIPILRDNKVMAILGVGNKPKNFTSNDVQIVSTFADFAWDIVENKRADIAIRKSEEKFRTLVDWTYDWENWMDPQCNFVYISPSCERITGYTPEEFTLDPNLLVRIIHPDDRNLFEEHLKINHDSSAGPIKIDYRIIARDRSEHWIEHNCRPLFGSDDHFLGRRVNNRDITERKLSEKKINEQNKKEEYLSKTILTIQTDIARDLHDTLGQNISYLRMNLEYLLDTEISVETNIKTQLQNMTKVANESYELIRAMLAILQTGDSSDPLYLFNRYAEQISERSSIKIELTSQGIPKLLSPHQIRQLFYIFREVLSNIEKYANAGQVLGEFLWEEHALNLIITDNGRGFNPDVIQTNGHYGLKFIRDRAELLKGSFILQSASGKGTTITVIVPYENEPQPDFKSNLA